MWCEWMQIVVFWWKCCCVGANHTSRHVQPSHIDGHHYWHHQRSLIDISVKYLGRKTEEQILDVLKFAAKIPEQLWSQHITNPTSLWSALISKTELTSKGTGFRGLKLRQAWAITVFAVLWGLIQITICQPKLPSAFLSFQMIFYFFLIYFIDFHNEAWNIKWALLIFCPTIITQQSYFNPDFEDFVDNCIAINLLKQNKLETKESDWQRHRFSLKFSFGRKPCIFEYLERKPS